MLFGHHDTCLELLKSGSDVNKIETSNGFSPLLLAIQEGHERIVGLLLNFGANIFYKSPTIGLNAVEFASKLGHKRIEKYLSNFFREKNLSPANPGILDGPATINKLLEQKPATSTIDDILKNLNLIKYSYCFQNINLEEFKQLSDKDLKDLGISLIGPRRKLSSAIASLDLTKN